MTQTQDSACLLVHRLQSRADAVYEFSAHFIRAMEPPTVVSTYARGMQRYYLISEVCEKEQTIEAINRRDPVRLLEDAMRIAIHAVNEWEQDFQTIPAHQEDAT